MIYNIKNKKITVTLEDDYQLPEDLKMAIIEHWNEVIKKGANIWNGEVLCVADIIINDSEVKVICKKSDYAHYLYEERIGCKEGYRCRNLSAGTVLETSDGYLVFGELAEGTSYPHVIQTTGGGVDKKEDIKDGKIDVFNTIIREAKEELNIDLNDRNEVKFNDLTYVYVSEPNEQPGVQFFSKAVINKTAKEFEEYFNNYNKYIIENGLEQEFEKLLFFKKETSVEELEKLSNPKRYYIKELLKAESVIGDVLD